MSYELTKKLQSVEAYDPVSAEYAIHLDANESFIDIGSDAPAVSYTHLTLPTIYSV